MITIFTVLLALISLEYIRIRFEYSKLKSMFTEISKSAEETAQSLEKKNLENYYLQETLKKSDEIQKSTLDAAQLSFSKLSTELAERLLSNYKLEFEQARTSTFSSLKTTQDSFMEQFAKVNNIIGKLSSDITDSKNTVDIIKQSLLSPSGAGALAEITLENILKSSFLRHKTDYLLQHQFSAEGSIFRPDALVFLPADNIMIIDAKASKYAVEDKNSESFAKSMHTHLRQLVTKNYKDNLQDYLSKNGIKFNNIISIMFLPSEQVIEKVCDISDGFLAKAWENSIFPVGPLGLMNMLSLARFSINDQLRTENYQKILTQVDQLLKSMNVMTQHAQKLGSSLNSAVSNYDKFVGSYNRNVLNQASQISNLGISKDNSILQLEKISNTSE